MSITKPGLHLIVFLTGAIAFIAISLGSAGPHRSARRAKQTMKMRVTSGPPSITQPVSATRNNSRNIPRQNVPGAAGPPLPQADSILQNARQYSYRGITIRPRGDAEGIELDIQRDFSRLIYQMNFIPQHRQSHFAWCAEQGATITNWMGGIRQMAKDGDSYIVEIFVTPVMTLGDRKIYSTGDHVVERYIYSNKRIKYLSSSEPDAPIAPHLRHF